LHQIFPIEGVVAVGSVVAGVNAVVLEVLWTFILQVQVLQE
jgi:hypothetical protein